VFGRPADYDNYADPVVRISAGEVRKRIAQCYQEPVCLRLRVRFVVDRHQIRKGHLRVLLRRRQSGVTQEFLNGPEVRAVAEKVGGVGVPETVGVNGRVAGQQSGVEFHDVPDSAVPSMGLLRRGAKANPQPQR